MLARIIVIVFAWCTVGSIQAQVVKKALFLGNSYTYYNNLPLLVDNFAQDAGNDLIYDSNTPGGYQMNQHASNPITYQKINQDDWDFVVIQGQSQEPSFSPGQVANDVYPYAAQINDSVISSNPCIEPMFFMTWGRKNGDASNCGFYPPVCTYNGMQQRLKESYMEMAEDNDAAVAPIGVAWKAVRDLYPGIELYSPDESHPSAAGSYLAAAVFYVSMFRESVVNSSFEFTLDSLTAYRLRDVASSTVLDSLPVWRINANDQTLALPADTFFCGDSLNILASGMYYNLSWSTGEMLTSSITVDSSGLYTATSRNERTCELSDSMNVSLSVSASDTFFTTGCDSAQLFGIWYYHDTLLIDTFLSVSACDSIVTQIVEVDAQPSISYDYFWGIGDTLYIYLEDNDFDSTFFLNNRGTNLTVLQDTCYFFCYYMGNVTVWNACGVDSAEIRFACESINELPVSWSVGPIPTKNTLHIANEEHQGFGYELYDLNGSLVQRQGFQLASFQEVDLTSFSSGQYILVVFDRKKELIGNKLIQKR